MATVVDFYSKLPKGSANTTSSGIKGRYFDGKNASGAPLVVAIVSLFGLGYTIDYNSAYCLSASAFLILTDCLLISALE